MECLLGCLPETSPRVGPRGRVLGRTVLRGTGLEIFPRHSGIISPVPGRPERCCGPWSHLGRVSAGIDHCQTTCARVQVCPCPFLHVLTAAEKRCPTFSESPLGQQDGGPRATSHLCMFSHSSSCLATPAARLCLESRELSLPCAAEGLEAQRREVACPGLRYQLVSSRTGFKMEAASEPKICWPLQVSH